MRLGLGAPPSREVDDDRVLHLFRNRAELKKAYSGVQDEVHRLKDRIKQQEGATARVQEMLQALEARSSQPDTAYPTLVFYQLRELWTLGRDAADAVRRRAGRAAGGARAARLPRRVQSPSVRSPPGRSTPTCAAPRAAPRRRATRSARSSSASQALRRFWHYFKRRALRQQLQAASLQSVLCVQDLERRAQRARAARRRAAAGIRRPVDRCAPRDQSGGDRLRADAVRAAGAARGWSSWRARPPAGASRRARTMAIAPAARRPWPRFAGARVLLRTARQSAAGDQAARGAAARAGQVSQRRRYGADGREPDRCHRGRLRVLTDDMWEIYRVLLR